MRVDDKIRDEGPILDLIDALLAQSRCWDCGAAIGDGKAHAPGCKVDAAARARPRLPIVGPQPARLCHPDSRMVNMPEGHPLHGAYLECAGCRRSMDSFLSSEKFRVRDVVETLHGRRGVVLSLYAHRATRVTAENTDLWETPTALVAFNEDEVRPVPTGKLRFVARPEVRV